MLLAETAVLFDIDNLDCKMSTTIETQKQQSAGLKSEEASNAL